MFFFLVLVLIEDIAAYCGKQHTINVDKKQEQKPLKSRLIQRYRVKYNYDDDNNDTNECNIHNENERIIVSNNGRNKESFVSKCSNCISNGNCKSKSKSKRSVRKQGKAGLNASNIGQNIDIDVDNNNKNNDSKDESQKQTRKNKRKEDDQN